MKRFLLTTLLIPVFLSCQKTEEPPVAPQQVVISASSMTMTPGDEYLLEATVLPANAYDRNVTWKSGDNSIATVTEGKVKAVNIGNTHITATSCNGKYVSCEVLVIEKKTPVSGISLDRKTLTLNPGNSYLLKAFISPEDASDTTIIWRTDNERVAVVVNGTVNAISIGKAVILATSNDGGFTDNCEVMVKNDYDEKSLESRSEGYSQLNNYSWKASDDKTLESESEGYSQLNNYSWN